ncbi:helix-turn-helix transcriptional regulator [Gelria sp. Kuro-4]|uniref:helix-turn-helix transcriptional regulator n=1 Tax=Gelria sp. Kuro-4 TaxID=2796927 RepID=UPI001BF005B8|nr:helix-turn-helix transcriptional regulator [Gelria sp. Kuro-4]BCV23336.1 hypothetical protein kuro4_01090 [Gelria sp. Kuro-4]
MAVNRVAEFRHARGLTQEQAARAAGLTLTGWRWIEQGKRTPSVATAARIAAALDVTIDDLFC